MKQSPVMKSEIYQFLKKIRILKLIKWNVQFFLWRARIARHSKETNNYYDVYKTYWIDPERIRLAWLPAYKIDPYDRIKSPIEELGLILGGDWDLETIPFEDLDVWQAFKAHFAEGRTWSDTVFYARIVKDILTVRPRWGCKTVEEFDHRLQKFDAMFQEIKNNGFRAQTEIQSAAGPYGKEDEIIVHISREGDYLFANGRHRLSIAKLLGVKKVPVKIARRHENWVAFRREILSYAGESNDGYIYHPITHPDLEDIPAKHDLTRIQIIEPYVPGEGGRLLDIGAHWGFFSHWFESLGFECTAVEMDPKEAYFLKKLHKAENRKFKIIESSIFDAQLNMEFDVVLALNIFHHFLKNKNQYEKLKSFLNKLNTRVMFFQPHLQHEAQMQTAFQNYSETEFVDFVRTNARLLNVIKLGQDVDGRSIYKLEK